MGYHATSSASSLCGLGQVSPSGRFVILILWEYKYLAHRDT